MKKVLAFGTFDILHPGHLDYLRKAKALGDTLVVVVARDESVAMLKKRKPALGERERLEIIGSLRMVDRAILGNRLSDKRDRYWIIKRENPAVVALGYDQRVDASDIRRWMADNGLSGRVVRLNPSGRIAMYKSSRIRRRIAARRGALHGKD